MTGNIQSSVVYLQTGQDSVQFPTRSETEEAKKHKRLVMQSNTKQPGRAEKWTE